jgi:hypothetical protein
MTTENTSGVNHVTIRSPSVGHVRPGLGRVLAWGAGVCLLGPAILAIPMMLLKLTPLYAPLNALLPREWLWSLTTLGYRVGPALAVLSAFASGFSWPRPRGATIAVDEGELRIRRRFGWRRIKKERIKGGFIIPSKPTPTIHVHLRGGDTISAVVNSEAEAERALEALGIGADRRRAVVTIGSTNSQMIAGCATFFVTSIAIILTILIMSVRAIEVLLPFVLLFETLLTLAVIRAFRPIKVTIGTDGVQITKSWSNTFIPYTEVDRVMATPTCLRLALRARKRRSREPKEETVDASDTSVIEAMASRIRDAMTRGAGADAESLARMELLEPQGKSFSAWRDALRSLAQEEPGYRRVALSEEDLLAVLKDPEAPAGRRVGAAIALRSSGRPEAPARIRIAADACASDPLREALARAAEDELDEETLAQALAEGGRAPRQ